MVEYCCNEPAGHFFRWWIRRYGQQRVDFITEALASFSGVSYQLKSYYYDGKLMNVIYSVPDYDLLELTIKISLDIFCSENRHDVGLWLQRNIDIRMCR